MGNYIISGPFHLVNDDAIQGFYNGAPYCFNRVDTPIEWAELQAYLNETGEEILPPVELTYEQKAALVREERDRRIAAVQWRKDRHADELALGLTPTEPIEPILIYIQALRDVPQQDGFPENIQWPEEP